MFSWLMQESNAYMKNEWKDEKHLVKKVFKKVKKRQKYS